MEITVKFKLEGIVLTKEEVKVIIEEALHNDEPEALKLLYEHIVTFEVV